MFKKAKLLLILGVSLTFMLASCATNLEKAKKAYNAGEKGEALSQAQTVINSGDPVNDKKAAVKIIGKVGGKEAGEILIKATGNLTKEVQVQAIKELGKMQYAEATDTLIDLLPDAKGEVYEVTVAAIGKIGGQAVTEVVDKYRTSTNKEFYKKVLIDVGRFAASKVTEEIASNLKGRSFFENKNNFDILIALRSPEVAIQLLKYIDNEAVAPQVEDALIKLGGNMAADPSIDYLKRIVGVPEKAVIRERLARIVGELRTKRALPILEQLSQDDSDRVRNAAEAALRKIRGF